MPDEINLNIKSLLIIISFLILISGIIIGFGIGINQQLKYDNDNLNQSAYSKLHLIRIEDKYYSVYPLNLDNCYENCLYNLTNISIIKD